MLRRIIAGSFEKICRDSARHMGGFSHIGRLPAHAIPLASLSADRFGPRFLFPGPVP